ncbi:hypothetical protein [Novosphingobium decolorationis]|uniref:Uncharacterized protein n=1 Tax=Novosphingobium decolorationis TaxID=2698673 RepID=A0ABX8E4H1_9SPHN|nr:hypothetical protein [Novosphingobium decolorationis]QVM82956.1 hypothetical protein HT578_03845 [Novosphingobium decolorationis]
MMESLATFGAQILIAAAYFAIFAASTWIGWKLSEIALPGHKHSEERGCIAMAIFSAICFMALGAIFFPAIHAIESFSCRNAKDYALCMDE